MEVLCSFLVFLYSGSCGLGVVGLFISFVPINLSQAFIITCVTRYWDRTGYIIHFIYTIMGHLTCSVVVTAGV